jgi:L-lactate dehydrogenase complex protein LldE
LNNVKGLELIEMDEVETCCGFGGTFSVKFEGISIAMAEQKLTNIIATGANCVVSTDCSCLMQIGGIIQNKNLQIETLHLADILASGW